MTDKDDLHRSGLAFGWLEETRPRRWSPARYWIASAAILLALAAFVAALVWWAA